MKGSEIGLDIIDRVASFPLDLMILIALVATLGLWGNDPTDPRREMIFESIDSGTPGTFDPALSGLPMIDTSDSAAEKAMLEVSELPQEFRDAARGGDFDFLEGELNGADLKRRHYGAFALGIVERRYFKACDVLDKYALRNAHAMRTTTGMDGFLYRVVDFEVWRSRQVVAGKARHLAGSVVFLLVMVLIASGLVLMLKRRALTA